MQKQESGMESKEHFFFFVKWLILSVQFCRNQSLCINKFWFMSSKNRSNNMLRERAEF